MSSELPPNERPARQRGGLRGPALGGAILIAIGFFFLLQTLGILNHVTFPHFNWWALFILIPLLGAANSAWQVYQANGKQVTHEVRNKAFLAMILLVVFTTLMYDLDWGRIWPVFLIIGGLATLLGGMRSRAE